MYESLLLLSLILFILFKILKSSNKIKKKKSNKKIPLGYKLFYTDQKNIKRDQNVIYSKLLYSEKYNLTGKPDYVYIKDKKLIPIELKSGKIKDSNSPHLGDLLQLVCYFLILEDIYKLKVKKGFIVYYDYTFTIKNCKLFKNMVLSTLENMKNMLKSGDTENEIDCSFIKCRSCKYRQTVCKEYDEKFKKG